MHYSSIFTLILFALLLCFSSCNTVKKMSPEQQREAQRDSVINASFKGLTLGDSYTNIIEKLHSMHQKGEIQDIKTVDLSEKVQDLFICIRAFPVSQVTVFNCDLVLRNGEKYTKTNVQCNLGFLYDSLYTIMLIPTDNRDERVVETLSHFASLPFHSDALEQDKVLETFSERYGNLYYIMNRENHKVYRKDNVFYKWSQIHEPTSFSFKNLVWVYKDAEIYLCDKTDYITVHHYDEKSFKQAYQRHNQIYSYSDDSFEQYVLSKIIKEELSGSGTSVVQELNESYIAYKYLPLHLKEDARIQALQNERKQKAKQEQTLKEREDSLKNEEVKSSYRSQDI